MATAPYLRALALPEQDGGRALPLQDKSLREPLAAGADPGEEGREQGLELLLRVWQRTDQGPPLKARWIASGDGEVLLAGLRQLGGACWGLSLEPRQPLQFRPLP